MTSKLALFKEYDLFSRGNPSRVDLTESRWTAPPEGYFSIGEQEDVNRKHNARENRKIEKIYEQQAIHCKEEEQFADVAAEARDAVQCCREI